MIASIAISACSPGNYIKKNLRQSSGKLQHHTGFVLYDPVQKKTLASVNGDKYFTPASNTKILTLYAGLKILGDSVPALRWTNRNDSLIIWGMGDPSFLYPDVFQTEKTFSFLKSAPGKLYFSDGNFFENAFGPGWSWADYQDYYQAERSAFPVYGNLVTVTKSTGMQPPFFQDLAIGKVKPETAASPLYPDYILRDRFSNRFFISPAKLTILKIQIPFMTSGALTAKLLSDTLKREVGIISKSIEANTNLLNGIHVDSLYKVMMHASDNFIAEQILLMCAQEISDSLKSENAINKMIKDYLTDLPDAPVWVDGSGLSRYNQMTPRTIVKLWEKIYTTIPQQRLFPLLVSNGKKGTLRNVLKNQPSFIFGKTGSLANNYCLSGYLITKKNRMLIFSSMNANFIGPTKLVRDNLEKILTHIYEQY